MPEVEETVELAPEVSNPATNVQVEGVSGISIKLTSLTAIKKTRKLLEKEIKAGNKPNSQRERNVIAAQIDTITLWQRNFGFNPAN